MPAPVTDVSPLSIPDKSRLLVLREAARKLEASFLAETLKLSGVGKPLESFGGGAGEEAFASFLVQEYADKISQQGGIGLAEAIFRSLVEKEAGR